MCLWIGLLRLVHVGDEVADAALVVELDALAVGALVVEDDAQARASGTPSRAAAGASVSTDTSSSSKISASGRNEIVVPCLGRSPDCLHVALRNAARELLALDLPVALHLRDEPLGERVDDGDAHAVQAAGDLVAVAAELAAGVQLRQHDRRARAGPGPSSMSTGIPRPRSTTVTELSG